jgi:hypothetical protein
MAVEYGSHSQRPFGGSSYFGWQKVPLAKRDNAKLRDIKGTIILEGSKVFSHNDVE